MAVPLPFPPLVGISVAKASYLYAQPSSDKINSVYDDEKP